MARSRDEILLELNPVRQDMMGIAAHMADEHGVRAENRDITDPEAIVVAGVAAAYAKRFAVEDGEDAQTMIESFQHRTCDLGEDCPGVDALQTAYDAAQRRRDILRAELPDDVTPGPRQAVQPRGLDARAMFGVLERHGG